MSVSSDLQKFAYGGDNYTFNVFEMINGSYQATFTYNIGDFIKTVKMDAVDSLYYIAGAADNNIYVFY